MRATRSDAISSSGVTLVPSDESPRAPRPARRRSRYRARVLDAHARGDLAAMDDAQRKQVKENGFLIIKDALTPATVALLNDIFVRPRPSLAGPFIEHNPFTSIHAYVPQETLDRSMLQYSRQAHVFFSMARPTDSHH